MISSNNNIKKIKSPKLQSVIVEPILICCMNGASIYELSIGMQRITPLPYNVLKKYLFFLINYEILSYNGQTKVYLTKGRGYDLLDTINKEKKISIVNNKDIVIAIEEFYH
jgi:hypothetical protein